MTLSMRKKLGEILLARGLVTEEVIQRALANQCAGDPNRLGEILVASAQLSPRQLAMTLAEQYGLPFVEVSPLPQSVLELVPKDLQRQFHFVPLGASGTELSIAMADLSHVEILALLEQQWTKVHIHVAVAESIAAVHLAAEESHIPRFQQTPVPTIAPVRSPSGPLFVAPPRAEDLFGDLNLESAKTGIPAHDADFLHGASAPLEKKTAVPPLAESASEPVEDEAVTSPSGRGVDPKEIAEAFLSTSGPIVEASHSSGPIVDGPFPGQSDLASPRLETPALAEWTGALDHLMPSKLVVGLTRALLARGLVTEDEILDALGQRR